MKKSNTRPASQTPRPGINRTFPKPVTHIRATDGSVTALTVVNECVRCGLEYCDCSCPENQPGTVPPAGEYWQKR